MFASVIFFCVTSIPKTLHDWKQPPFPLLMIPWAGGNSVVGLSLILAQSLICSWLPGALKTDCSREDLSLWYLVRGHHRPHPTPATDYTDFTREEGYKVLMSTSGAHTSPLLPHAFDPSKLQGQARFKGRENRCDLWWGSSQSHTANRHACK